MQERRNSIVLAMELRLSCINPSICIHHFHGKVAYFQPCPENVVNTLGPGQYRRSFADIFKRIFLTGNIRISIQFSLKFVPRCLIENMPAIGSDNGLVPIRRQAIICTKHGTEYTGHHSAYHDFFKYITVFSAALSVDNFEYRFEDIVNITEVQWSFTSLHHLQF